MEPLDRRVRSRAVGEGTEHVSDLVAGLEWVPQWSIEEDFVHVVVPVAGACDVAGIDEVLDDAVHGSFADADEAGDLGEAYLGVLGDADQDVGVVCQERP